MSCLRRPTGNTVMFSSVFLLLHNRSWAPQWWPKGCGLNAVACRGTEPTSRGGCLAPLAPSCRNCNRTSGVCNCCVACSLWIPLDVSQATMPLYLLFFRYLSRIHQSDSSFIEFVIELWYSFDITTMRRKQYSVSIFAFYFLRPHILDGPCYSNIISFHSISSS